MMREKIANIISRVLNPFLVSLVIILVLSFESMPGILDAIKWSLLLSVISIAPVYATIIYFVRVRRLGRHFVDIRRQRTKIYLIASLCALTDYLVLFWLDAPLLLMATFIAGLSAVITFMGINLWWKISLHSAFIAASVTILVILYGGWAALSVVLLPLVAWARITLAHHSIAQVAVGALLASLIVATVFYLFGLV